MFPRSPDQANGLARYRRRLQTRTQATAARVAASESKNISTVAGTKQFFTGPFGVRHQPQHVTAAAADTGDVVPRAVRIGSPVTWPASSQ